MCALQIFIIIFIIIITPANYVWKLSCPLMNIYVSQLLGLWLVRTHGKLMNMNESGSVLKAWIGNDVPSTAAAFYSSHTSIFRKLVSNKYIFKDKLG